MHGSGALDASTSLVNRNSTRFHLSLFNYPPLRVCFLNAQAELDADVNLAR